MGYTTLYGDMCGGFNPLKDLYKTDIYALARWRNVCRPERSYLSAEVRSPIPESVLRKAPSAELRAEQQDSEQSASIQRAGFHLATRPRRGGLRNRPAWRGLLPDSRLQIYGIWWKEHNISGVRRVPVRACRAAISQRNDVCPSPIVFPLSTQTCRAELVCVRFSASPDVGDSCTRTWSLFARCATQGVAGENVQARIRALILDVPSNASGELLSSTGNKSELAVGCATLCGDMCGSFESTQGSARNRYIRFGALVECLSSGALVFVCGGAFPDSGERVAQGSLSAELRAERQDSDSLPPYNVLDSILRRVLEEEASATDQLGEGTPQQQVADIWNLVENTA